MHDITDNRLVPLFERPDEWLDARRELPTGHFGSVVSLSPDGLTVRRCVHFGGHHGVQAREQHKSVLQLDEVPEGIARGKDATGHRVWRVAGDSNVWYPDSQAPVSPQACDPSDETTVVRYPTPVYLHEYVPFKHRVDTLPMLWLELERALDEPFDIEEKQSELCEIAAQM